MQNNNGSIAAGQLEQRIQQLPEKIIPMFAFRAAARVLPLISSQDNLDFWKNTQEDNRVRFLAAAMATLVFAHGKKVAYEDISLSVAQAAEDILTSSSTIPTYYVMRSLYAVLALNKDLHPYTRNKIFDELSPGSLFDDGSDFVHNTAISAITCTQAAYCHDSSICHDTSVAPDELNSELDFDIDEYVNGLTVDHIWRVVPDWFVDGVKKLINVISSLPKNKGQEREWEVIEFGVSFLKEQAKYHVAPSIRTQSSGIFQSEKPSMVDSLNRQSLADALAKNLVHKKNSDSRTIGLLGDWGAGKTTFVNTLKSELVKRKSAQPFIFGEFNAWAYEHTDNIQAGIAQEVLKAVTSLEREASPKREADEIHLGGPVHIAIELFNDRFKTFIRSVLFRSWITLCYSFKAQFFKLLKSLLILFIALVPLVLPSPNALIPTFPPVTTSGLVPVQASEADRNLFPPLRSWAERHGSLLGNSIFQLIWVMGFGLYFLRQLPSLLANPLSKELLTYIRLPDYAKHLGDIPVMHENIKVMCGIRLGWLCGKPKRMLFVVDDLDRCRPESIVKVLEAVRLVMDLENVIVIIAIDQHIAMAALSNHFKEFSPHHKLKNSHAIAREYLSKVINFSIVLAEPSHADVKNYMEHIWSDLPTVSELGNNDEVSEGAASEMGAGRGDTTPESVSSQQQPPLNKDEKDFADARPEQVQSNTIEVTEDSGVIQYQRTLNPMGTFTREKRESFIQWVKYFKLTNPRQLKRLNNSYELMCGYFDTLDQEPISFLLPDEKSLTVYPMLLTLILMEYLNSLEDLGMRAKLWKKLFSTDIDQEVFTDGNITHVDPRIFDNASINQTFIKAYRKLLQLPDYQNLAIKVEAFVLPAMV